MRKFFLMFCLLVMAASLALAQGTPKGDQAYTPTIDVFGAHLNNGRGCAACHAPHSGGRSSGYFSGTGAGVDGNDALWGTDVTPVMNQPFATGPGGSSTFTIPTAADWSNPLFKQIGTCLSCHDGNLSKAPMMAGSSWEQGQGMLDFSGGSGATLYGSANIPTLLGDDGSGTGNYENDHPVGPLATIGAVWSTAVADGMTVAPSAVDAGGAATSTGVKFTIATGSKADDFNKNYGFPAVKALRVNVGETNGNNAFVVCTTCHQQHNMVVFTPGGRNASIRGLTTGAYRTYFFVKGPYNPGAPYDSITAPSTMQFCRQCHFSMSNEAFGSKNIGTAF